MNTATIHTVTSNDLSRLGPELAVDVFRDLLFSEATVLGIGKHLVNVPGAIDVADGGIDAEVRDCPTQGGQGLIKPGLTRYQIKTGDFSLTPASFEAVLFRDGSRDLKPRVKACLDRDGTFVLVLFGSDIPDRQDNQAVGILRRVLVGVDAKYQSTKLDVWRQNTLVGFLGAFPSLALQVTGRAHLPFQNHRSWARQDDMALPFQGGDNEKKWLESIREELRKTVEAVHVRILGEAGIGKTRLTLEVTTSDDLRPLVLYCDTPRKAMETPLLNELLREDNRYSVILIVDDCDRSEAVELWNKLKHLGPRIKVVTLSNDVEQDTGNTRYFTAPQLDEKTIGAIIQGYEIDERQADRWSQFCDGSPRVAHVIGANLRAHPEDLLRSLDTVDVWGRYVIGTDQPTDPRVEQRRIVLRHIALFKRFGYWGQHLKEAQAIAGFATKVDPNITWARFQEIVQELKRRRILQGEYTLYITPRLLHIRLWRDFWETYGRGFDFEQFTQALPPSLLEWFYEMWEYAAESPAAVKIVKDLLGPSGIFPDGSQLKTALGARFFLALATADPTSALDTLARTVGTWSKDELRAFDTGRREIVWALERIAIWRPLFPGAARLLLTLAEAENETCSNNATGVFSALFSPGYGPVATTETPPPERLPILIEALSSESAERRRIGRQACGVALNTHSFTRMIGAEYQGLRRQPQLWRPSVWGELFDAYRGVWNYLAGQIDNFSNDGEKRDATHILLNHASGLCGIQNLASMVLGTLSTLAQKPWLDRREVLTTIIRMLHYEAKDFPKETREQLEGLRDQLTGSDYPSLLRRYVGMDVFEDKFDEGGKQVDQAQPKIEELAQQAAQRWDLLEPELVWLVTDQAENGYRFGYALGKADTQFKFLPRLLQVQRQAGQKGNAYFLGGYFRALYERQPDDWERQLDLVAEDSQLQHLIPELTWRSGLTDKAARRILSLARKKAINVTSFSMFRLGGVLKSIGETVLREWVEYLLEEGSVEGASIALDMLHFYYLYDKSDPNRTLPKEMTLQVLLHEAFFEKAGERAHQMAEFDWKGLAMACLKKYGKDAIQLTDKLVRFFGVNGTIIGGYHTQVQEVLAEIARQDPAYVWDRLKGGIGPPTDSRAFDLTHWLNEGALNLFPANLLWEWVDEDIEKRSGHLARFVPKSLFHGEHVCLAREMLARYGHREDVRQGFSANYWSGSWTGPESNRYDRMRQDLLEFRKREANENVKKWIDEFIAGLEHDLEDAKVREERRGY